MQIFTIIDIKNRYVQSCLVISLVSVTTWITKILKQKYKIRQNNIAQHNVNDKIISIPLIVITGCDTGLGYSIVMRYLKGEHSNKNQNDSKVFNLPFFNNKALIVPSRIAIVAFCLNPNGAGAKWLLQQSLKNNSVQLFVKQMDLTSTDSIKAGANFVTDLLQQNVNKNDTYNEIGCLKYGIYKRQKVK